MIGAVTGVVMILIGFGLTRLMRITPNSVDWVLERLAAMAFVGAGLLGVSGWIGDWLDAFTQWVVRTADRFGGVVLGQSVVGLIAIGLAVWWVCAFLPKRLASNNFSDALIYVGFFIPGLLAAGSGPLVDLLQSIFEMLGNAANNGVQG